MPRPPTSPSTPKSQTVARRRAVWRLVVLDDDHADLAVLSGGQLNQERRRVRRACGSDGDVDRLSEAQRVVEEAELCCGWRANGGRYRQRGGDDTSVGLDGLRLAVGIAIIQAHTVGGVGQREHGGAQVHRVYP